MKLIQGKNIKLFRSSYFMPGITFLFLFSCQNEPQFNDLDLVKAFKPDDKFFKSSLTSLHFVIETSSIEKIDSLFSQIIDNYNLPKKANGIPDGIYSGQSPADAFVPAEGPGKQEDEAYCKEMSLTGTTPAIAYPAMEEQMLEEQDMMNVDAVSGATYSLYRFRYALSLAMIKAVLSAEKKS